jgi:low affinity Fe/Cu permease
MNLFDRFADLASRFVSRAWFFVICVLLVVIWAPSLPLFKSVDTWQLIINTATTIITFLLVALLQNTQWRGSEAINRKLDATADGLADTMESLATLMNKLEIPDHEQELLRQARELRDTVGVEKRISSSGDEEKSPVRT